MPARQDRDGPPAPREWDAATYDALPLPHERWGDQLLAGVPLEGGETVLDAGAGTGRDTEKLLRRLPRGRVIAVDGSRAMLDRLLRRFAGHPDADRLAVLHADLRQPLRLLGADGGDVRVDLVFSVATLHWLPDHAEVFRNLAAVLRPGGRLHAEWGGRGNLAAIERVLAELGLPSMQGALTFAGAEETRQHLRAAGFVDSDVSLHPDPVRLEPGDQIERFLATVVLGALLDRLPAAERAGIVHAVASRLPQPVIDYVRLRVRATRA